MRILILLETLTSGGAETFALRLANDLSRTHSVLLAVIHGELVEPELLSKLDSKVEFRALSLPWKSGWWKVHRLMRMMGSDLSPLRLAQILWLSSIVRRFNPDVVHSHLLKTDFLSLQTRRWNNFSYRSVITTHGDYEPALRGLEDPQLANLVSAASMVMTEADAIVTVSEHQRRFFEDRYPAAKHKLHKVWNGYKARSSEGLASLPAARFRFGMVSRGVRLKGWDLAIDAFAKIDRKDSSLILVGEGPHIDYLRKRPLPEGVILCGHAPDPFLYIRQFDVGLLPTLFPHEGLPTAVVEYLHCGKPVIATRVGEIPAMIETEEGFAGRLLNPSHGELSVDELASLMEELMNNPALLHRMSQAARKAAERFDMSACTRSYEKIYANLHAE